MANPKAGDSLYVVGSNTPAGGAQGAAIPLAVDALDGATLTGDTLTTSATPTVDELETAVGVLGGKINAIIAILETQGFMLAN